MRRIMAIAVAALFAATMLVLVLDLGDGTFGVEEWEGVEAIEDPRPTLHLAQGLFMTHAIPLVILGFVLGAAILGAAYLAHGSDQTRGGEE